MPAPMTVSEINAVDFFEKEFKTDALGFTWAHAVNEYSKLKDALKGKCYGVYFTMFLHTYPVHVASCYNVQEMFTKLMLYLA